VTSAEKYVTFASLIVLTVVLLYIVIYAIKLYRLERAVIELSSTPGVGPPMS
jgi:hypothetical protein